MHRLLPHFRSPKTITAIDAFLCENPQKAEVLCMLSTGLRAHWGPQMPPSGRPAANYLGSVAARHKCRLRCKNEVLAGRMIGGPGWTPAVVRWFLRKDFYVTPCGAVSKGEDPHGRIVHNYSHQFDGLSLNDALIDNSVSYISFKERARLLAQVTWYFKVDLENGYRQVPVSPMD